MNPGHPSDDAQDTTAFVVLHHADRQGAHYDLMIDRGEHLATWKSSQPPEEAQASPLTCQRIGDHRRMYLEYEGPVSGDRGTVRRHDSGSCEVRVQAVDRWHIQFHGERLIGDYELARMADGSWELRPQATNS